MRYENKRFLFHANVPLADITTDNPNVWFEVGFAMGERKEVVLVSSVGRSVFPFDIRHRNVVTYQMDSASDFAALKAKITARLLAVMKKEAAVESAAAVASPVAPVHGLAAHELVALVALGQNANTPNDPVGVYQIRQDIERAGFTGIAGTLALASLLKKDLVSYTADEPDYQGNTFPAYRLTDTGLGWLNANLDKLTLTAPKRRDSSSSDDVPF